MKLPENRELAARGHGVNETAAEKRAMREQIARARAADPPIPWLDKVPAREFFAALGITEPPEPGGEQEELEV